jgi:glycerol-3-phosphate cytidylyltransferase-like family protein/SAM-dependent methyltransferase
MLVETEALARLEGAVTLVSGGFDPIHPGHIAYFAFAATLGLPVVCNVDTDAYVAAKHPLLLAAAERAEVLDAIRYIDYTHRSDIPVVEVLDRLRPRYFVKGADWKGRLPAEEVEVCAAAGISIVYADTVLGSSTRLAREYARAPGMTELRDFERAALAQSPFPPERYDRDYFTAGWRANGARYDLETRRRVEGRHPQLIREVFAPGRVLDVGCGPGFLMAFLAEMGIDVHGVDFSPDARALAPPEVRDRIVLGDVTAPPVPDRSFDLVVCREVLEHLTVLQVRRTIAALCRATSRFVYATTRFHPDPPGLLSVATDLDTDPTHITLLSPALVRMLFVLEGMRRRVDLEERLDWASKGRVLVYERVA